MNLKKKEYLLILEEVKNNFKSSIEKNSKYFEEVKKEVKNVIDENNNYYKEYKKRDLSNEEMKKWSEISSKGNLYINALNDIKTKMDNNLFIDLFINFSDETIKNFIDYDKSGFGENFLKNNKIVLHYEYYNFIITYYQDNYKYKCNLYYTPKDYIRKRIKKDLLSLDEYAKTYNEIIKLKKELEEKEKNIKNIISENDFYNMFVACSLNMYDYCKFNCTLNIFNY